MIQVANTQTVPLTVGEDGTIRIAGSRVTLDVVLHAYLRGDSPAEIHTAFPAIRLSDVYGAIYYYLEHREQVDEYLHLQEQEAETGRRFIESQWPSAEWRARLQALRDQPRNDAE